MPVAEFRITCIGLTCTSSGFPILHHLLHSTTPLSTIGTEKDNASKQNNGANVWMETFKMEGMVQKAMTTRRTWARLLEVGIPEFRGQPGELGSEERARTLGHNVAWRSTRIEAEEMEKQNRRKDTTPDVGRDIGDTDGSEDDDDSSTQAGLLGTEHSGTLIFFATFILILDIRLSSSNPVFSNPCQTLLVCGSSPRLSTRVLKIRKRNSGNDTWTENRRRVQSG
ncbi:hypothetical protein C8R42DRAFT_645545 [Lentinula raphanica]|nr:hypothetical protein C8R42DRAFT_645545 [Lentinula raphanica]